MSPRRVHPEPDWFAFVRAGDVFRIGNDFRIVRNVSRKDDGRLFALTFAIRRRSWTNRPYTVYMATDFRSRGSCCAKWRYVGDRVRLGSDMDRALRREILNCGSGPRLLFADDVRGVA